MKTFTIRRIAIVSLLAFSLSVPTLPAQPAQRYIAEGVVPTPIEVARAMAGERFTPRVKMRGLAVPVGAATVAIATSTPRDPAAQTGNTSHSAIAAAAMAGSVAAASAPPKNAGVLAIPIPFAFDSSRLASHASPVLDSVAEGIKLLGGDTRVLIEGHTDAAGQDLYNLRLSKQRAQSVKQYLVTRHGIAPSSLITIGKGEREPLNGLPTNARENRRVQFQIG
jgi:outer membrane protein OmpA-like peptidoglycan-associated protein